MVSRTQITLDPELHRKAKERAADMGISLAEYVRRLVAGDLGEAHAPSDPSVVFNLGDSGGSNVSRHKDEYVGAAALAQMAPGRVRRRSRA
jgi:hypothetical protein